MAQQYYVPPVHDQMGGVQFDGVVSEYGEWIPNEPANRHWVEYQDWLAQGNTPAPWPPEGPVFVPPP
jgi:hypothetical protein